MYTILVIMLLFITACTPNLIDVTEIPSYDVKESTQQYLPIAVVHAEYHQVINYLYLINEAGITYPEETQLKLTAAIDKYLFWSSVANLQNFYGQYSKISTSVAKAKEGISELETIIQGILVTLHNKNGI